MIYIVRRVPLTQNTPHDTSFRSRPEFTRLVCPSHHIENGDIHMPLDFTHTIPPRMITRLARTGVLNDPAACDAFLIERVSQSERVEFMRVRHPSVYCVEARG